MHIKGLLCYAWVCVGIYVVCVGVCFAFAPLALLTAFSKGAQGRGCKGCLRMSGLYILVILACGTERANRTVDMENGALPTGRREEVDAHSRSLAMLTDKLRHVPSSPSPSSRTTLSASASSNGASPRGSPSLPPSPSASAWSSSSPCGPATADGSAAHRALAERNKGELSQIRAERGQLDAESAALRGRERELDARDGRTRQAAAEAERRRQLAEADERDASLALEAAMHARSDAEGRAEQILCDESAVADAAVAAAAREQLVAELQVTLEQSGRHIEGREAEVGGREGELLQRERRVARADRAVAERELACSGDGARLAAERSAIDQDRAAYDATAAALLERRRALAEREGQVDALGADIEAMQTTLQATARALQSRQAAVADAEAVVLTNDACRAKVEAEYSAERSELAQGRAAHETAASQLQSERETVEATAADVAKRELELCGRAALIDEKQTAADAAAATVALQLEAAGRVQSGAEERAADVARRSRELEGTRQQLDLQQKGIVAERIDLEGTQADLEEQMSRLDQREGHVRAREGKIKVAESALRAAQASLDKRMTEMQAAQRGAVTGRVSGAEGRRQQKAELQRRRLDSHKTRQDLGEADQFSRLDEAAFLAATMASPAALTLQEGACESVGTPVASPALLLDRL